jgi:hypothetical protein
MAAELLTNLKFEDLEKLKEDEIIVINNSDQDDVNVLSYLIDFLTESDIIARKIAVSHWDTTIKCFAKCNGCDTEVRVKYKKDSRDTISFKCEHPMMKTDGTLYLCNTTETTINNMVVSEKGQVTVENCIAFGRYLRYMARDELSGMVIKLRALNVDKKMVKKDFEVRVLNGKGYTVYKIAAPNKNAISKVDLDAYISFQIRDINVRRENCVLVALSLKKSPLRIPYDIIDEYLEFHNKIIFHS